MRFCACATYDSFSYEAPQAASRGKLAPWHYKWLLLAQRSELQSIAGAVEKDIIGLWTAISPFIVMEKAK